MADFDAFDRMSRTLRGANPLPPGSPMANMAENLRQGPMAAPPPAPPAFDKEVVQRAQDMAKQRGAADRFSTGAASATPNQGVSPGVQGQGGAQSVARPGTVDLAGGGNSQVGSRGYGVGSATAQKLRTAAPVLGFAGKAAGGVDVISNFNDYKIDDPSVDSSARGTFNALRQGDFAGAGRSLSKGMLETGMDLGSNLANTADLVVPGKAPVSTAYNQMLRNQFGDQLIDNTGSTKPAAPTAQSSAPTRATGPTLPANRMGQGFDDPRRIDRDPSRQSLGASRDFSQELAGVPANLPQGLREGVIYKTMDSKGRPVYSGMNVGGNGNAQFVDGAGRSIQARGSVETSSGPVAMTAGGNGVAFTPGTGGPTAEQRAAKQAGIDATLTNPNGSRWTQNDNAIMAANLRDGVDPYRGTSRGAAAQGGSASQQYLAQAERAVGMPLDQIASKSTRLAILQGMRDADNTAANNQTSLRTAEIRSADSRYSADAPMKVERAKMETAARMRQMQADIWERAKGDPRRAQAIAVSMGLDGEAFSKIADADVARDAKGRAQTNDLLAPASITNDKDGNPVINPALQARNAALVRQMTGGQYDAMTPDEKTAAAQRVLPAINVVNAANARKDVGLRKAIGLDAPAFESQTLPEFSGNAEEVGFWEGLTTYGLDRGDLKVPVKGGGTQYLARDKLTKAELESLKANGASLRGAN